MVTSVEIDSQKKKKTSVEIMGVHLYATVRAFLSRRTNAINATPSVPLCLSSIPFWDVLKYCPVSKNKSHYYTNVPIIPILIYLFNFLTNLFKGSFGNLYFFKR